MEDSRKRKRGQSQPNNGASKQPMKSTQDSVVSKEELQDKELSLQNNGRAKKTPKRKSTEKKMESPLPLKQKGPKGKSSKQLDSLNESLSMKSAREKMWCSDCQDVAADGCDGHSRVSLKTARHEAAAALQAAQQALQRLDELEAEGAPRFKCTAELRDDEGEREEGDVEVTLAACTLTSDERRALCTYLEGLELEPDEDYLSASSAGCEAIATRCAKLPDRVDGIALKPGAILLLGTPDVDVEEDADASWLEHRQPALRIYYDNAVKPEQGRGAKVLGYITRNLKHVASAKPGGTYYLSGWGERYDSGKSMTLSNVKFIAA